MRRLAPLPLLWLLGCATAIDLESTRGWLLPERAPEVPQLSEQEPPAELPPVEGLRAVSNELRAIPLRWSPTLAGPVGGYAVERASAAEGPFERIAVLSGRFENSHVDRGGEISNGDEASALGDGDSFHYRVRAFDESGRLAAAGGPTVSATTAAPPEPPRDLVALSYLPRQVALHWEPARSRTATGYVVYRSPSEYGDYLPIARIDDRFETSYVDAGLGDLRVLFYRVTTANAADGEGDPTEPARAVTKPEPLPPAHPVLAGQELGINRVRWEPNVEPDLTGYRLWAEPVTYTVTAFDRDGLESVASDPVEVTSVDYELRGAVGPTHIVLAWSPRVQRELQETRVVWRKRLRDEELGRSQTAEFRHEDLEPGKRFRYQLVGVRPDGSEAPPSAILELQVPEAPKTD
jgi:fibronectin type 3 domain-containing protein